MTDSFFDLNNPFEKQVSGRLDEYLRQGLPHDVVLQMIGRDFPYMSSEVREHCEITAYLHHYSGNDGMIAATFKHVALLHSKGLDKPFHSHQAYGFHIRKGEDVFVAVQVENPLYLYDKANVHLAFLVDGKKVNELKHTVAMEDRRNIYYVPLNILENIGLSDETCTRLKIDVVDENIAGNVFSVESDIYYGETDPSEVFTIHEVTICLEYESMDRGMFDLSGLDSLYACIKVSHDGHYGPVENLECIVTVSPAGSADSNNSLVRNISMFESEDTDGRIEGCGVLFNHTVLFGNDGSVPYFKPAPGKYKVDFHLLNTLVCSKEIEFIETAGEAEEDADDFDRLLEEFIREMEAVPVENEVDPSDYVEVVGLNLYDVDNDEDDIDKCLDVLSSSPMTVFAADGLKMLSVVGKLKILKETDVLDRADLFRWVIYDQAGRAVDWNYAKKEKIHDELWVYAAFGDFCKQQWIKGTYRVELKWLETTVINASFTVGDFDVPSDYDPKMIGKRDNTVVNEVEGSAIARLDRMAGLENVKEKVRSMMNYHKFLQMRSKAGLPVKQPSLHARFLGNPGTGKTTVARLLGQIYKEMGILSSGHVVVTERKNLMGRFYDSEGQAVDNALNRAKGGILLIDEAYNLYVEGDEKDPGRRVLECLLTALSDEDNRDWMLILAGYPKEMEEMLQSNPGIESRVSKTFYFDDLSVDELLQVAELYCDDNKYELTQEARERLRSVITRDVAAKDKNFGNGRYVIDLLETAINTRMAARLEKIDSPTYYQLVTIEADDIPISAQEAERISSEGFDEEAIADALDRLDSLVGLNKVKNTIHNFVNISRFLNSQGERFRGKGLLKWNFTGNSGTGKSTVAQILADILKAMNLIRSNEITEVKGEEIFNVSDYTCNEVIREAAKKSGSGLLFIDGDAPEFRSSEYRMTSEQIRFKLATLASDENASGALIIADCPSSNLSIAHTLASNGVYDFDHVFVFDDYTEDELYRILLQCLDKQKTKVSEEAEVILREYIRNLCANRNLSFANARTMKNLSRSIFETVVLRMSGSSDLQEERVVLASDVGSFVWKKLPGKIGFHQI